jgi:hypothetical protein
MRKLAKSFVLFLSFAGLLGGATSAWAAACANVGTGNWGTLATWAAPCNAAGRPNAGDDVTIINNSTVTVNIAGALANSVTIAGGNAASTLTFNAATSSLTVTNNVVIGAPTAAVNKQITVLTGTLIVGSTMTATAGNTNGSSSQLTATSGSITIGGGVTLTGGTTATRDALLTVSSGLITIDGGLIINATVATSSTASITAAGGRITVNGAAGVTNGDVVTVGAGTFSVTNAAATFNNTSATNVASTTVSTGTLSVTGNLTNAAAETMTLSSTGNITVGGTLTNNGTVTLTTTGNVNANGDFTNSATGIFTNTAAGILNIGGNATMSGTFNQGTGTVTFNSATPQTLGGTVATTFNNLTINKASNNLTINTTPTVNATLTFTRGQIITGANAVIVAAAGTIATPSASSYVVGNFQKMYAAGNLSYFAGNNFPVGDATNFTPVNITAGTTTTAGSLTVSTTATEHPQVTMPIASTGIDANNDIARYWRFINTGLTVGTAITATFTFVAGDVDSTATTANFIVQRYDGTNWNSTTLVAANPLNTQASNITPLIAGNNDFAIGDPLPGFNGNVGAFEVFEASTPANAYSGGRIYTKIVGTAITLQVVAVNAGRTGVNVAYNTNPITVALLDSRDNTGAITAATDCRSTWATVISTQSLSPVWTNGRSATITITAPANAWRDVRVRVTNGANIGCSTDRFSIRPTAFTSITSTNANNTSNVGGTTIKAGQNFNLSATTGVTVTGYDNGSGVTLAIPALIPLIDNTIGMVAGSPNAGTISGSFNAASSGTATGAAFSYSEVGNFGLSTNAVYDNVFTAVDQPLDCTADFSNTLVPPVVGMYGCKFGSIAVPLTINTSGFGRFIPDHFAVSGGSLVNRSDLCPLGTGCPSAFTYMGEQMNAVFTLTAQEAVSNTTTTNYAGVYAKLNPAAAGNPLGLAVAYAAVSSAAAGIGATTVSVDKTVGFVAGDALWIPGAGAAGAALNATVSNLTSTTITLSTPIVTAVPLGTNIERDLTGSVTIPTNATGSFAAGVAANISAPLTVNRGTTNWYPVLNVGIAPVDSDGVSMAVAALNLDAAYVAGNDHASIGSTDVRYGLMKLTNAHGSELLQLPIAVTAQYWNGLNYATNIADSITTLNATMVTSANWTNLTAGNWQKLSTASTWAAGATSVVPATASVVFVNGVSSFKLAAPGSGKTGSVDMTTNAPTYLSPSNTARATFGVYKGANEFIYQRENY